MEYTKEQLGKLIKLVLEISNQQSNKWFKEKLISELIPDGTSANLSSSQIDEIYEHCLRKIIKQHAERFYSDFKLIDIIDKLISDFIRMEKFRRDDNFEDFCLAAYQQLESIISELIKKPEVSAYFKENKDIPAILKYDHPSTTFVRKGNLSIGKMIFLTSDVQKINNYINGSLQNWFFNHKFRAVLYLYYFNKEIKTNTDLFDRVYEIGNFLYQGRNLNHRGSIQSHYQKEIIDDLIPNQHKYYFKFLGFLEDFITTINKHI